MERILRIGAAALATLIVAGCGAGQAVKDSTLDAAKWVFTTKVKTLNLDLVSRSSLNANGAGQSLSTVVRIYQLKTAQTFEQLDYAQLQTNDREALNSDLLATKDVVLRPDASASVSEPMNSAAEYVGVAAFFRDAGRDSTWKLVLPKRQWKKTDPVRIEVRDNTLRRIGAAPAPAERQAPQLSLANPPPAAASEYEKRAGGTRAALHGQPPPPGLNAAELDGTQIVRP